MKIKPFGKTPDGKEVSIYTLCDKDLTVDIMTYGASVNKMTAFGTSIVGGHDELLPYIGNRTCHGASIGRVANRIADACFEIDGTVYNVKSNEGKHTLHGGMAFNHSVWDVTEYTGHKIVLSRFSPDGECGFPGNMTATVKYELSNNALCIEYSAVCDKKTPVAMTNHSYFNLDGFGGTVDNHYMQIFANAYTEVDGELIPTGNRPDVTDTAFDFRKRRKIGEYFGKTLTGYDHNFVVTPERSESFLGKPLGLLAVADNGRLRLSAYSDQTNVQFYTGNFLEGKEDLHGGVKAVCHGAFCLEAQTEPNAIKRGECIYDAGERYVCSIAYKIEKLG